MGAGHQVDQVSHDLGESPNLKDLENRDVLDARGLASFLGVSERTVREYTAMDVIPCVRIGRCVRYIVADVVSVLKKRSQSDRVRRQRQARKVLKAMKRRGNDHSVRQREEVPMELR